MSAKSLMFQGTASNVGKSVLVAGLCRAAHNRGISVAPFKPQNMSNNAAVCSDGGEIGRAQALQALACGLRPETNFNPVLLKPQSDRESQVIVQGRARGQLDSSAFFGKERLKLLPDVMQSFEHLRSRYELVLIEGAGSPAETNLREGDIANMGFAQAADIPVSLIADIDRGGVIASLVGTKAVLSKADSDRIQGFIINKFRGDISLFDAGITDVIKHTGWKSYGIVPWLAEVKQLPEEDAVPLEEHPEIPLTANQNLDVDLERIKIVAPVLSRIANFDDLDPLRSEPNVELVFIPPGQPLPMDADAAILLGTKSSIADAQFMKDQGWDIDLQALARQGKRILGICGGFQLLGVTLQDETGADGPQGHSQGLGLLAVDTCMKQSKTVRESRGRHENLGTDINGYEIHVGETTGADALRPFAMTQYGSDGATSLSGLIEGTYLHGIFSSDKFRTAWLKQIRGDHHSELQFEHSVELALNQLARSLEKSLDIDQLLKDAQ